MLTEQLLATTTVEAFSAKLRVVGNNTLTDLETPDLGSNGGNYTNGFVAWRKRLGLDEVVFFFFFDKKKK